MDKELNWEAQLYKVTNRAYRALWSCRGTFGKTSRLKQWVMHWIYNTVVTPIMTYAAMNWWPRVKYETCQAKLSKLQRLACLGITGAMGTVPTTAIEILLRLPPFI